MAPQKRKHGNIFASGEAGTADAAYVLAEKNLWEKIGRLSGSAEIKSIQHSIATRIAPVTGVNIASFDVETREVSTVIVSLLAAVATEPEGSTNV